MMGRMTRSSFEEKVLLATVGERITYHIGSLMYDRTRGGDFMTVDNVAHAAFLACEAGSVHLTQRYIAPCSYEYIAVKKPAPRKPVEWVGCYSRDPMAHKKVKVAA